MGNIRPKVVRLNLLRIFREATLPQVSTCRDFKAIKTTMKTLIHFVLWATLAAIALWGCTPTTPVTEDATPAPAVPISHDTKPVPPVAVAPIDPAAPAANVADLTPTHELDDAIISAEKSGDKAKIGAAYADRGYVRMNDDAAGPKIKYRKALSDFKKALAADPKNEKATKAKKAIEDVYASMGMPVPDVE
jgi:PBP1b-binding outer membrane lipoprotein LpoB